MPLEDLDARIYGGDYNFGTTKSSIRDTLVECLYKEMLPLAPILKKADFCDFVIG
jgi:hypothetical protein